MKYKNLISLCEGKNIALIGNAPGNIASQGQIDAHEIVIRLNAGAFMPDPHVRGTKLDAVFFSITGCEDEIRKRKVPGFIVSPNGSYSEKALREFNKLEIADWEVFKNEVGIERPTTGILTLLWILKYGKPSHVTLYGFDGFKTGNFYSNRPISMTPHSLTQEQDLIGKLAASGVIGFVPVNSTSDVSTGFLWGLLSKFVLRVRRVLMETRLNRAAKSQLYKK